MSDKAGADEIKAMFTAVRAGDVNKVKTLLKAGVSPDARDEAFFKEPALSAAARAGQEAVFLELVKAGADVHACRELGWSVLQEAYKGTLSMVMAVLADGVRSSDRLLDTLRFACCNGSLEVVKALIAAGADVNHKSEGATPLITAVKHNRPEIVAELLKQGAKCNVTVPREVFGKNEHYKKTALELAVAEGNTEIVALLQAAGAKAPSQSPRPAKPSSVADSWKRIERWLRKNAPGWKPLQKGASAAQVESAEAQLGFKLPDDLRECHLLHDGSGDAQIFPCADDISYVFLPLSEVAQDWNMLKELLDGGDFKGQKAKGDKGVRNDWWNTRWVPFASNGGGDHFCIDLDPAAGGAKGQVIVFRHDRKERSLLAPSLGVWLFSLANALEDGKLSYEEEDGIV